MTVTQSETIRRLNDAFRQTGAGGRFLVSAGIAALPPEEQAAIVERVRLFEAFNAANDPHAEHDFGAFEHAGCKVFFKIDYYDRELRYHSEDATDPAQTCRILTIMLPHEY